MKLPPFLLDQWLDRFKTSGIRHDLASSTGPTITFRELLEWASEDERRALFDSPLIYCPAAGSEELRAGIATMHGARTEDVIVTTGAAEALHILFFDAAEPGANVVVSAPGFPPTWTLPESLGLEVRRYHLRPENHFRIDLSEVSRLVDARTRVILVTSPHNPTGAVLGETEKLALADLAASRGALLVSDEVYHPLYYEALGRTAASLPGTIVVGDFSKALCLSGLRLGYLIDGDRARRERWLGARMHFTITSPTVSEALAVIALKNRDRIFSSAAARVAAGHAAFSRSIERLSGLIGHVPLRGGTTAFPWLTFTRDSRPFAEALAAEGVLVAPGDCFDAPHHFRMGFGASEDMSAALRVFEEVVRRVAQEAPARAGSSR
jgi:aspartate/methionine/tyrosine aminotransferase